MTVGYQKIIYYRKTYITELKLSSFDIEDEDIYNIIKTHDINKAHKQY